MLKRIPHFPAAESVCACLRQSTLEILDGDDCRSGVTGAIPPIDRRESTKRASRSARKRGDDVDDIVAVTREIMQGDVM